MTFFTQINEAADEQLMVAESIEANTLALFEGFSVATIGIVCESAATFLGNISAQLGMGQKTELPDFEKVVDVITALRVLGTRDNREAFNVKQSTFKVIVQKVGDAPNVDAALVKLAKNPSVATIRSEVENMLKSALQGEDNMRRTAVHSINRLRLGYERVQNKLQSMDPNAVGGVSDKGSDEPSKPTLAASNPAARPSQQKVAANNRTGTFN